MRKIIFILLCIKWIEALIQGNAEMNLNRNLTTSQNFDLSLSAEDYKIYWNVPTFMCHRYGMSFNEVESLGIEQNKNDRFRGEKIAILYDPGMFPALMNRPNNTVKVRNKGVPQKGNLDRHLKLFEAHLEKQIDKSFSGIGIIDMESWRPIFRQHWASLAPYRKLSLHIERKKNPTCRERSIENKATERFEWAARVFMEETLLLAKQLRPDASWGYYAYPYCFNLSPHNPSFNCSSQILEENMKISWLWELSDIILPSVYFRSSLSDDEKIGLIAGRLDEAVRLVGIYNTQARILPYFGYKYTDHNDLFLSKKDVANVFEEMIKRGANGHIIWGSSSDFNSREKCQKFEIYFRNILGPAVLKVKQYTNKFYQDHDEKVILYEK